MSNQSKNAPGFHHVAIRVADFDATLRFYQDGLGFALTYTWGENDGRGALLDTGDGNYLEVFAGAKRKMGEDAPESAILHFALRSPDVDAAFERAIAAGGRPHIAPKDAALPGKPPVPIRIAFVYGPDGEDIEFFANETF